MSKAETTGNNITPNQEPENDEYMLLLSSLYSFIHPRFLARQRCHPQWVGSPTLIKVIKLFFKAMHRGLPPRLSWILSCWQLTLTITTMDTSRWLSFKKNSNRLCASMWSKETHWTLRSDWKCCHHCGKQVVKPQKLNL